MKYPEQPSRNQKDTEINRRDAKDAEKEQREASSRLGLRFLCRKLCRNLRRVVGQLWDGCSLTTNLGLCPGLYSGMRCVPGYSHDQKPAEP